MRRHDVATLYALNTFGAVAGCLVATFWLLELFGTQSTLWLAAAVNVLVAVLARQVDRSLATWTSRRAPKHPTLPPRTAAPAPRALTAPPGTVPALPASVPFVLTAAAVVGFAFFLMELVWYRLLAPLLGGSVFTFGLVLALALVGIGIGGLLYALIAGDKPATLSGFALSCLIEAAVVAATFALGDRVALLALVMLPLRSVGFAAQVASWTIIAGIVVLPPALVAGYQFPLLIALFGHGRERVGRQLGLTYAANTIGAIVGALAGGFGLLPWLSAPGAWRLVAGFFCCSAWPPRCVAAALHFRTAGDGRFCPAARAPGGARRSSPSRCMPRRGRRPSGGTAESARAAPQEMCLRLPTGCWPGPTCDSAGLSGRPTAPKAASRWFSIPPATRSSSTASRTAARGRRGHAGDARPGRRAHDAESATCAGHRPGHGQLGGMARRGAVHRTRRRRRARAADPRRGARVQVRSTTT